MENAHKCSLDILTLYFQPNTQKMCTPDPKCRVGGGGTNNISNGVHRANYVQHHQMKGPVAANYQRSYSYDSTNSAATPSNTGKYAR